MLGRDSDVAHGQEIWGGRSGRVRNQSKDRLGTLRESSGLNESVQLGIELAGIGKILAERRLAVPIYQRSYAWKEEQVKELEGKLFTFRTLDSLVAHTDLSQYATKL